jgi:tetratricopeptide (TPR) repeat protein
MNKLLIMLLTSCFASKQPISTSNMQFMTYASEDAKAIVKKSEGHGSVEKAIDFHLRKLSRRPKDIKRRVYLAKLYLIIGDLDMAEKHANIAKQTNFRDREAKLVLATSAYLRGLLETADLILADLGGEQAPEAEVLNLLAGIAYQKGDNDLSIKRLKKLISRSPRYVAAHMNLGLMYLQHQEYSMAAVYFRRTIDILPDNRDGMLHLGIALSGQGKYGLAMEAYAKVEDAYPHYALVTFNKAVLEYRQRHFSNAISLLQEYVDKAPTRYLAKKSAKALIDDIQLERVKSGQLKDADIEGLVSKLEEGKDSKEPLAFESGAELNGGFVFTSVGYLYD